MNETNNPKLKKYAQKLRREMTKEERHLWYDFLKDLPVTFNRQKVFGPYILDFYCAEAGFAVELDGSQHYEEAGQAEDKARDAFLKEKEILVLRYSNRDVNLNFAGVCQDILSHLPQT